MVQSLQLKSLETRVRACRLCIEAPMGRPLPHDPRPVLQISTTARLAICGQAPGTRAHASGQPFTDPSGDRLRAWTALTPPVFYDAARVAIVPMGFCFPGLDAKGSDLPPRRECAATWHAALFAAMPQVELVLLVGHYAARWHLGASCPRTLTDTVAAWRSVYETSGRRYLPLPHPSWRNNGWLRRHPWFETELLPVLRTAVARAVD
jgi:uracil-DNA glycosylase